jgi:hypothetical protein
MYRVVWSVFCGVMYIVVSRKFTVLVEYVTSYLMVGWNEFRCSGQSSNPPKNLDFTLSRITEQNPFIAVKTEQYP